MRGLSRDFWTTVDPVTAQLAETQVAPAPSEQRPPAGADGGSDEAKMPFEILILMASGHLACGGARALPDDVLDLAQ
jgi:hypothetical protein